MPKKKNTHTHTQKQINDTSHNHCQKPKLAKTTPQITTNTATPPLTHKTQPPRNPTKSPPNPLFLSSSHQTHYPKPITTTVTATITAPPNHNHHHGNLKLNQKTSNQQEKKKKINPQIGTMVQSKQSTTHHPKIHHHQHLKTYTHCHPHPPPPWPHRPTNPTTNIATQRIPRRHNKNPLSRNPRRHTEKSTLSYLATTPALGKGTHLGRRK